LYREAEKQFSSSLKIQVTFYCGVTHNYKEMIHTYLWVCKVYHRLDQPNTILENYLKAIEKYPGEVSLMLGVARLYDALNDMQKGMQYYKKALQLDASSIEAVACLASNQFYSDQPELALRYYRRLLQMGISTAELWNNLGLCCFYSQQYDMTLSCFERAVALADDDNMSEVWYNVGQVAIGIGDLGLAYQAFKVSASLDTKHAESFNNLGVRRFFIRMLTNLGTRTA
jgi:tetratricopeptide repeat protein 8